MKDRILNYIQNFYSLGVARELKEKHDCELYAIIDISKYQKNFFEEQKIIEFEKKWYLRDYILPEKNEPDIEYLSNFEKKYNINLWLIAYMDRNFHEYNRYYKFNRNEILCIFEQECRIFEKILNETKPDFVITSVPDYNQNKLLFEICKALDIKILMLIVSRLGYRSIISAKPDSIDYYDKINSKYLNQEQKTVEELRDYWKDYTKLQTEFRSGYRASMKKKLKSSLRYFFIVCNNEYRKYYINFGRTRTRIFINESSLYFKKLYRGMFLKKHSLHNLENNEPYVYYPLHLDPEQSSLLAAPFYNNQLNLITNIAKSLPAEYKLYVKEHPAQVLNGWRDVSYYKNILNLPNVHLLHPSISNHKILQNCSLVITIAGTLGFEATFYGKPTIVFTDTIFSELPSVKKLKNLEELPQVIRNSLKNKVEVSDLNKFVSCLEDNSFEYPSVNLEVEVQHKFFGGGFYFDFEIPLEDGLAFIEKHKPTFSRLAEEYIKKINQHKKFQLNES